MKDLNKVFLLGRLGSQPVRRETKNGTVVTHFSMATSKKTKVGGEEGVESELKEETQWHKVVVWGKQGEVCAQYLQKGNPVLVEGSMRSRKYDDSSGVSRMSFEIHAESISFLPRWTNQIAHHDSPG
ncbi:single-stranded DNA-binding protein [bacterium]|jgi:single-strand DNA-binding protein|nr:single-stranded DNA-binding protein [bacterium]